MIEEEAKTKWCPFVQTRYTGNDGGGVAFSNRPSPFEATQFCIGSACMAWRQTDNEGAPSKPGEPISIPQPAGYCGLAGKS